MTPKLIATGIKSMLPMDRSGDELRHVSSIIRSLCLKLGHYEDSEVDDETRTRWELGQAFEAAVIRALCERYQREHPHRFVVPGPVAFDDLVGNPDLVDVIDLAIIEIKLTWLSSRHDVEGEKFWKYWVQAMAYARMAEMDLVRLHVCHINGDYKSERGPTYNVWEKRCTPKELDQNWRMLTSHGAVLRRDRNRGK